MPVSDRQSSLDLYRRVLVTDVSDRLRIAELTRRGARATDELIRQQFRCTVPGSRGRFARRPWNWSRSSASSRSERAGRWIALSSR